MSDEKENPKLAASGLVDCVPNTGPCPQNCLECYYNGPGWYRTRDEPLIPAVEDTEGKIVRVNSGHDSNIERDKVIEVATKYADFFFNTSIPRFDFPGPVVFTCNGRAVTKDDLADSKAFLAPPETPGFENIMFVRFRLNMWNLPVANAVVAHYSALGISVVMTFMRYKDINNIPEQYRKDYVFKKNVASEYFCLAPAVRNSVMKAWESNPKVLQCGSSFRPFCKYCGNCSWLYRQWKFEYYKRARAEIERAAGWV